MKGFEDDIMENKEKNNDNLLGCFIKLVDYALDQIGNIYDSDFNSKDLLDGCTEAKIIFSELLTHAMVIAHISLEEDKKIIEGSCQSVSNSDHVSNTQFRNKFKQKLIYPVFTI